MRRKSGYCARPAFFPSHRELQPQNGHPATQAPRNRGALGILERFTNPVYDNLAPLVQIPINPQSPDGFGVFKKRVGTRVRERHAFFQCTSEPNLLISDTEFDCSDAALEDRLPGLNPAVLGLTRDGPCARQIPR